MKTNFILFRNDLHIHDNKALFEASITDHLIPKLAVVPPSHVHQPHLLSTEEQRQDGISIGKDYPVPVIDLEASYGKLNS